MSARPCPDEQGSRTQPPVSGKQAATSPHGRTRTVARLPKTGRYPIPEWSTDRHAQARSAWRNFARTAGARPDMHGGRRSSVGVVAAGLVGLGVAVAVLSQPWGRAELESGEPTQAPAAHAQPRPVALPAAAAPTNAEDRPQARDDAGAALSAGLVALFDRMAASPTTPPPQPAAEPDRSWLIGPGHGDPGPTAQPGPPVQVAPKVPEGTHPAHARAFHKLPTTDEDRQPVGNIAREGTHVDRIQPGVVYDRGECSGEAETFSLADHDQIQLCFRVVHPRKREQVTVRWLKDGALRRRTFVTIPDHHGYRTRAGLTLRDGYAGSWEAKVVAEDGTTLASAAFVVEP